jgi:hypothetical protein
VKTAIQTTGQALPDESVAGALLSPIDSSQRARPLRAWRKHQREWVQLFFGRLSDDWHRAWGLSSAPVRQDRGDGQVHLLRDDLNSLLHDDAKAVRADPPCSWCYWTSPDDLRRWQQSMHRGAITHAQLKAPLSALYANMFGEALTQSGAALAEPSVALELSLAAWADWWQRLAANVAAPPNQTARHLKRHPSWSGSLQIHLSWCGGTFVLELNVEQVTSLLTAHAPRLLCASQDEVTNTAAQKASLLSAVGNHTMPLRAMLNGVELSLRQIQSLRVGDIVPLRHRLDEPTLIETPDAFVVCHGWLGQRANHVAVEMVSPTSANHEG